MRYDQLVQGRGKHYKNLGVGGDIVFVTTTCLDFAHLFQREELRLAMLHQLVRDCQFRAISLDAFVIMTHHIHVVSRLPQELTVSRWVQSLKSNSAKSLLPQLNSFEIEQLRSQSGLNRRSFWKSSFRSFVIGSMNEFNQKVDYVHDNPVRGKLSEEALGYRFSSAKAWANGIWSPEKGLDIELLLEMYE